MFVKKIKYTDYNGTEREEKFYFHLNKAELMKMQFSVKGGFEAHLKRLLETQNEPEIMKIFEDFVDKTYGVKSPDGKSFIKDEQILNEFKQTEAYSEFFMELMSSQKAQLDFIKGIMPDAMLADVKKELEAHGDELGIDEELAKELVKD